MTPEQEKAFEAVVAEEEAKQAAHADRIIAQANAAEAAASGQREGQPKGLMVLTLIVLLLVGAGFALPGRMGTWAWMASLFGAVMWIHKAIRVGFDGLLSAADR